MMKKSTSTAMTRRQGAAKQSGTGDNKDIKNKRIQAPRTKKNALFTDTSPQSVK